MKRAFLMYWGKRVYEKYEKLLKIMKKMMFLKNYCIEIMTLLVMLCMI